MESAWGQGGSAMSIRTAQKVLNQKLGDTMEAHISGYANLVAIFETLKKQDPNGVYIVELMPASCHLPKASQEGGLLQYTRSILIPSAMIQVSGHKTLKFLKEMYE